MMDLLKQVAKYGLSRISLVTSVAIAIGLTAGWVQAQQVADEIMTKFGLKSGELIMIYPERLGKSELAIKLNGNDYVIDYAFHSMRSKDFRLLVPNESGELVEQKAPTVSTIRGSLRDVEGSAVTGCVTEDGCCAMIEFPTGEACFIQPVENPALPGVHVVYEADDVADLGLQCGCHAPSVEVDNQLKQNLAVRTARRAGLRQCETIVDADFEYFSIFGSVSQTNARMEALINIANRQYESEAGIRLTVSNTIVRNSETTDPYTTSDGVVFLDQVENYYAGRTDITGDVCHVFTGRVDLFAVRSGATVGINGIAETNRFIGTNIGIPTVCEPNGISITRHQPTLNDHAASLAHEIGHNFGLRHIDSFGHTMYEASAGSLDFHNTLTVPILIANRDALNCLETIGSSGNGFGLVGNVESNDDLINANLIPNLDFSASGNNFNMTTEAFEPDLSNTGSTVWCYIAPSESGTLTLDTFGSDFDTQLHVYQSVPGGGLDGLNLVDGGGDDDTTDPTTGSTLQSQVTIDVAAGTRYEIRVGGYRSSSFIGAGGEGNIQLTGTFAPGGLLGDVNLDGVVDFGDIPAFIDILIGS